ncbi:MAG: PEP-CTERM sorting domain-containing protein [Opitutales bacterium]|nr:PEP-CTERM sorting domain-containing protein [Opitutales bacterium]
MKTKTFLTLLTLAATGLSFTSHAAIVLVEDTFGGTGDTNLAGTSPGTFDSAIADAGGTGTWAGHSWFKADGTVTAWGNFGRRVWLDLGDYINDAKGTSNGLFTLTVTMSQPTEAGFVSGGFFFAGGDQNITFANRGLASASHNNNNDGNDNYYMGPGTANSNDPGNLTDTVVTFTTELDLRGFDGISNFGSVTFSNSFNSNTFTSSYTADQSFDEVGLSVQIAGDNIGIHRAEVSQIQLAQIPEPSTYALVLLSVVLLTVVGIRCRRRTR